MNTLFIEKKGHITKNVSFFRLMAMRESKFTYPSNNRSSTLYNRMNIKYIYLHTFKSGYNKKCMKRDS